MTRVPCPACRNKCSCVRTHRYLFRSVVTKGVSACPDKRTPLLIPFEPVVLAELTLDLPGSIISHAYCLFLTEEVAVITFNCPTCGRKLQVADHLAGKSGQCPCGTVTTVPIKLNSPGRTVEKARLSGGRLSTRIGSRRKSRHAKRSLAPVIIITVVVAAAGVAALVLSRDGERQTQESGTSSPVGDEKHGKVIVTVTWKYNDFVGHRADTDALVVLIPQRLRGKLSLWLMPGSKRRTPEDFRKNQEQARKRGAYYGVVGGDGKLVFDRVSPGQYTVVIISENTKNLPGTVDNKPILSRWFDEVSVIGAGFNKVHTAEIELRTGEEFNASHDFGLTGF
jgi:hypothetical protein